MIKDRVVERQMEGYYVTSAMVQSQVELLEVPCDEADVVVVNSGVGTEKMLENVVRVVRMF